MSSYKNNRLCYIPEHVIVRNVEKVLNGNSEENDSSADAYFRSGSAGPWGFWPVTPQP